MDELAADPDYNKVVNHGGDMWPLLVELADRADAEAEAARGCGSASVGTSGTAGS